MCWGDHSFATVVNHRVSEFVDNHLKPVMEEGMSYLKRFEQFYE